ncbi:endonuclease/exonuclease/phosphatase family protein [Sphingobacterium phlebotomi]|uniref:Endonuclease/exonuclease/phosphatase family protein n=1 Tax=Sphingobacterium phlebotomi TaxID=2605433 RepID=A0A5D4H430_9SPHI|nr:endonuclease/exonuclease/phosphatase family protein [Sphingobacterium phlebotomi]TYR34205.1 endonuclease/exonuclease/phosphatase family protein [Sphingobacterium phlebotomi]
MKKNNRRHSRRIFLQCAGTAMALPFLGGIKLEAKDLSVVKNSLKILTCNIRVDLEDDAKKRVGWRDRREACLHIINQQEADVIGFQEVLKNQFLDLKENLKEFWGIGFDGPEMDQHTTGYHGIAKNPIFFRKKRFELLAAGGYWLSETPLVAGSMSWDSARARNAAWVRLLDKSTGKECRIINLHLDHVNKEAKYKQIEVVLKESAQYPSGFPQILVGDFNASVETPVVQSVFKYGWKDSYAEVNGDEEPGYTVHLFKGEKYEKKDVGKKIDFIFTRGGIKTEASSIVKDAYNSRYPSDHYFVESTLVFD